MIDYALNLIEKKGMEGIVNMEIKKEKQVKFYNERVETIKEWEEKNMEIFMAGKNKKMTFNVENPTKKKIREAIEKNIKIMKLLSPCEYYGLQKKTDYRNIKKFDEKVIEDEYMVGIAEESINKGGKAGIVFSGIYESEITNSSGIMEKDKNSMTYLSVRTFYRNLSAHDVSCGRKRSDIDAKIAENIYEMIRKAKEKSSIQEGKYDVMLYPMAFANLISNFSSFSSAFYVDAGYSFLEGKIGKKIGSDLLTIYDDGTVEDGVFSSRFDEEGNATQRTIMVEKGILKNYLHNSTTAHKYGTITTGNAGVIVPHPWNIVVENGEESYKEMMEDFNGIIITNLWYTRYQNYRTGDFSSVARDVIFRVHNGKKTVVKRARISDNMERILRNIRRISMERKQIFWWEVETPVYSPYVIIKDVGITLP